MTLGWANGSKYRLPQDVIDRTTDGHSLSLYQLPFTYKHCNILHERSIQLCPVHIASCAIDSTRKNSRCLFSREFTTQRKKNMTYFYTPGTVRVFCSSMMILWNFKYNEKGIDKGEKIKSEVYHYWCISDKVHPSILYKPMM